MAASLPTSLADLARLSAQSPYNQILAMDRSRPQSLTPPPAPRTHRSSRPKRRHRGYSLPRGEKSPRRHSEVTLLLCVFNSTSHNWHTSPLRFDPNQINDCELWTDIRNNFRTQLHPLWKRLLGFKRVKSIVPIGVRLRRAYWMSDVLTRRGCVVHTQRCSSPRRSQELS